MLLCYYVTELQRLLTQFDWIWKILICWILEFATNLSPIKDWLKADFNFGWLNTCGPRCFLMASGSKNVLLKGGVEQVAVTNLKLVKRGNALTLTPSPAYGSTWGRKQFH